MNTFLYKFHKNLLYIFIFLLPWQTVWIMREIFYGSEKWQYGTVGIYLSDVILIAWIVIGIYLYKDHILTQLLQKRYVLFTALALTLWSFASIIWANDKTLAFYFALNLFFAFNLFFLIQCTPLNKRTLSITFVISAFIQSIIGIIQFSTQQTFAQKILGLSHYDIWRGGTAIVNMTDERWLRVYGGMPHPNIFGGLLLAALLVSIYLFATTKKERNGEKTFLLVSIALFTTNIFLTFSRVTWIAVFIGIVAISIFIIRISRYTFKTIVTPFLLIVIMCIFLVATLPTIFSARVSQDATTTHNSFSDRYIYIQQAQKIITQRPLLGTGSGNYTNTVFLSDTNTQPIWYYQPVHNIYMLITAEMGIIGLVIFSLFLFFVFLSIFKRRKNVSLFHATFAIIMVLMLFIGFFDHWPWTAHFGIMFFFLVAGLAIPQKRENKEEKVHQKEIKVKRLFDPLTDHAEDLALPSSFSRTARHDRY